MQPPPNAAASGGVLAAALWQHAPVAAAALAASGGLLQASKRGAARRFAALSGGARRRAASWVRQNRGTPGSCEGTTHAVSSICSTSSCHAASSSAWEQLGGGAPAWLRRAASGGSGSNSGGGGCGGGGGGGWRPASSAPSTWQHGLLASPPPPWRPAAPRAAAARGLHASPSAREQQQPPHPAAPGPASGPAENATAGGRALRAHDAVDALKVAALIHRFRARGHLMAQLDPLQRCKGGPWVGPIGQENDRCDATLMAMISEWPEAGSDDERAAFVGRHLGLVGPATADRLLPVGSLMPGDPDGSPAKEWWGLAEVVEVMRERYCGTLAVEYKSLFQQDEIAWVEQRFERRAPLEPDERVTILKQLLEADTLERFLSQKFPASKRFGLEGCEALLPGLHTLMRESAAHGVERVMIGMAHRGRLNVLVHLLGKPIGALCSEMEGLQSEFKVGDVKYHLGQSGTLEVPSPRGGPPSHVELSIAPNPSHLEAVCPVVLGMVRAEQARRRAAISRDDTGWAAARRAVMGLLIHGDAAFSGLGLTAETLQLSDLPGYTTGGCIHVVINNQIGFTTLPRYGRSSPHATDIARVVGAPVLHANADDPDAVAQAFKIAADWRARFGKHVVVDLVCYRRNGHNELDDARATLPLTCAAIDTHAPVLDTYALELRMDGLVAPNQLAAWRQEVVASFEAEWAAARQGAYKESAKQFLSSSWQGDALSSIASAARDLSYIGQEPTGLPLATLQRVGAAICTPPAGFNVNDSVAAMLAARRASLADESGRVDWATAEALAFGTLVLHRAARPDTPHPFMDDKTAASPLGWGLNRGHYSVRLSGQDAERGTFNQRHAVLWDQKTPGRRYVMLSHVKPGGQDEVEVWNSPLQEGAVLGFEYGYSIIARDTSLVLWEAQFGDFANNAQVIIDQFVASGEEKWGQQSALVMLLPHGYDGQGPDHSSARIERFLQACCDDPDHLPGYSPAERKLMRDTYEAVVKEFGGKLNRSGVLGLLRSLGVHDGPAAAGADSEPLDLLWGELGFGAEGTPVTRASWERFMLQWMRRNAERNANMFVVNATTPAQYFHLLRRQVNLRHKKPLALFTSKYLLHHRPATSALVDFTTGSHFNRVIDDGKASDNTRHKSINKATGEPFLLPPERIRRVVICSGQIYYHLSKARRARRVRDVVLVRLEQISPFPHDLLVRVVRQYRNAQLAWCQEEPRNMGAWWYVRPRLHAAIRFHLRREAWQARAASSPPRPAAAAEAEAEAGLWGYGESEADATSGARLSASRPEVEVIYIGRPPAASPATASFRIHLKETEEIIDAALA